MPSTPLPDGFTASSDAEFLVKFELISRLRVLFGRPMRIRQSIFAQKDPGNCEIGEIQVDIAPIGGKLPE